MRALLLGMLLVSTAASADWQNGYTRKDGTYVQGHYKAAPDAYRYNNPSSQSRGGSQRDEFSSRPRYNLSNPNYNSGADRNRNGTYDWDE